MSIPVLRVVVVTIALLLTALISVNTTASEPEVAAVSTIDWPLIAPYHGGELQLHHPQVESLKGNRITARAAFSITTGEQTQPIFGVVWLAARAVTDRDARTITLSEGTATKVHLPGATDQEEALIVSAVTAMVKGLDPVLSLDHIVAALSEAEGERESAENLNSVPPKISTFPCAKFRAF